MPLATKRRNETMIVDFPDNISLERLEKALADIGIGLKNRNGSRLGYWLTCCMKCRQGASISIPGAAICDDCLREAVND